jgi:tRNA-splicing ligase RtcB (3'-phosphate/5'-hydroxy nucleic acid ligase)
MPKRPPVSSAVKDAGVIDETPMAYKSIDAVMGAQRDLVDVAHTLRQVVCVKG